MLDIIPKPVKVAESKGKVNLTKNAVISGGFDKAANILTALIKDFDGDSVSVKFVKKDSMPEQSYKLSVNEDITIEAADEKGAIYAVQTIVQLYRDGVVPCVTVEDAPNYKWRGFMMDCSRHFWTVEHIKSVLDIMSNLKMSVFHWHLTDDQGWRVEIKKYPLLTEHGAIRKATQTAKVYGGMEEKEYGRGLFYTQEDVKEVVRYAASLGIDIVPEIDMPGHLVAAISCYPYLSCEGKAIDVSPKWGILDTIGCCGNPDFYKFVEDVLDEICELFPFNYFHIGGDEVPKNKWKSCPKCQAKMKELGYTDENQLQGYFNNHVSDYVKAKGKRLIGWNEVLDAGNVLDDGTVIQWWTPMHGKKKALDWLAKGNNAILTKHQNFYMDHSYGVRPLKKTYNFTYKELGIKDDTNVLGIEAPQWVEYIRTKEKFDFNTFPRMMALSECAWTKPEARDYAQFEVRLENMREWFMKNYDISIMAPQRIYRRKHIKGILKEKTGWIKWSYDPDAELKEVKAELDK